MGYWFVNPVLPVLRQRGIPILGLLIAGQLNIKNTSNEIKLPQILNIKVG